jgi:hypothetical protein
MSAEEVTIPVEAGPVETNNDAGAAANTTNGKKGRERKDEKPIEELFDLSKPIPKVRSR